MNDSQLVMEHARKFATQFSGFLKACDIIGSTGALEQLADEAQKRYDDLAAKADDLAVKHAAAEQAMVDGKAALADATTQAALIKKGAADEADTVRAQTVSIMQDARTAIAEERMAALQSANAAAVKIIADTNASLEDVTAKVTERSGALAALDNAIAIRRSQLELIKQDIAALSKKFQAE